MWRLTIIFWPNLLKLFNVHICLQVRNRFQLAFKTNQFADSWRYKQAQKRMGRFSTKSFFWGGKDFHLKVINVFLQNQSHNYWLSTIKHIYKCTELFCFLIPCKVKYFAYYLSISNSVFRVNKFFFTFDNCPLNHFLPAS